MIIHGDTVGHEAGRAMADAWFEFPVLDIIDRAIKMYSDAMRPYVVGQLRNRRQEDVVSTIRNSLKDRQVDKFDPVLKTYHGGPESALSVNMLRTLIVRHRDAVFRKDFDPSHCKLGAIHYITEVRNENKYGVGDAGAASAMAFLGHMVDMLDAINNSEPKEAVERQRDQLLENCLGRFDGSNRNMYEPLQRLDERDRHVAEQEVRAGRAIAVAAGREAQLEIQAAAGDVDESLSKAERIAARQQAAVVEHETAVAEHEEAVAELEAAAMGLRVSSGPPTLASARNSIAGNVAGNPDSPKAIVLLTAIIDVIVGS